MAGSPPGWGGRSPRKHGPWAPSLPLRYTRVRAFLLASSLVLATGALASGTAFAQTPASERAASPTVATPSSTAPSPATHEVEQVVDLFMAALVTGQLDAARSLMTPDAVVVANGQVFATRDAYIDGAAKGDAAALRTVQTDLVHRNASTDDAMAWVMSEKRLRNASGPQAASQRVVETMMLARTTSGWKITHVHWSGRAG